MRKILNGQVLNALEGLSLSSEMIAPQPNDAMVTTVVNEIEKIAEVIRKNNYKSADDLKKNVIVAKAMHTIEESISKRLGLNFHLVTGDIDNCFCMPVTGGTNSGLNMDIRQFVKDVDEYIDKNNIDPEDYIKEVDKKQVLELGHNFAGTESESKDMIGLYTRWRKNQALLQDYLMDSGKIIIDLQAAKMHNVPKDIVVTVAMDFIWTIQKLELTARETAAILLHEVGHGWTFLEYAHRQTMNNSILMETLKDNTSNGKSAKEKLILVLQRINPKAARNLSTKNNIGTISLTLARAYVDANLYSSVDSEQMADQFATRFGLGAELSTAMGKLNSEYRGFSGLLLITFMIAASLLVSILIALLPIIIVTIAMGGFTLAWLLGSIILSIKVTLIIIVVRHLLGADKKTAETADRYDDMINRVKRMKFDLVRQLRTSKMPDQAKKQLLAAIDNVDAVIEDVSKIRIVDAIARPLSFLWEKTSFTEIERMNYERMDKVIESLMENDLHVATAKLQTFKK